jgi:hypothetical protein
MNDIRADHSSAYDLIAERVQVDYAIRSDFLNPDALTAQLGIQPSRAWSAGDQYASKAYDPLSKTVNDIPGKHPWGLWGIDTKSLLTKDPDQHLIHLLHLLEPKRNVIQTYLDDSIKYTVRFYIWWEPFDCHGGYTISSSSLMRAATLCQRIDFGFISKPSQPEAAPSMPPPPDNVT